VLIPASFLTFEPAQIFLAAAYHPHHLRADKLVGVAPQLHQEGEDSAAVADRLDNLQDP
jgi:hypothetical protein